MVAARVLVAAPPARGPLLRLSAPLSFWGGVDPVTGVVSDPRHPQHGVSLSRTVLALPGAVGSSSSSAIMLELLRHEKAPAAILMAKSDAILALGVVVGRELGLAGIGIYEAPWAEVLALPEGRVEVAEDGRVTPLPG